MIPLDTPRSAVGVGVKQAHHTPVCRRCALFIGLVLGAANGAVAQVSSINSAILQSHVFNDVPASVFTGINQYPSSITLGETGMSAPTGYADRDVWRFSNNGTTAYQFGAHEY